jgi:acetyl esterase/lipase
MTPAIDPEFDACVRQTFEELGIPPDQPPLRFPRGDVTARRNGAGFAKVVLALEPAVPDIVKTRHTVLRDDGFHMPVFEYRTTTTTTTTTTTAALQPAVLYFHGGGMIFGSAELFEPVTMADVAATGVPHFSV